MPLKSSDEQLQARGFLSEAAYLDFKARLTGPLCAHLGSRDATIRTFAARSMAAENTPQHLDALCERLTIEKKLYTKIEICNALTHFGEAAFARLLPLLGKIGSNQHTEMANVDLGKKSYPLPRDIVARILIRMGPQVLPYLEAGFHEMCAQALSEALDVIGHISASSGDTTMEGVLFDRYTSENSALIRWKLIRAFQAFPTPRIINALTEIIENPEAPPILAQEAQRSLDRICERNTARGG